MGCRVWAELSTTKYSDSEQEQATYIYNIFFVFHEGVVRGGWEGELVGWWIGGWGGGGRLVG